MKTLTAMLSLFCILSMPLFAGEEPGCAAAPVGVKTCDAPIGDPKLPQILYQGYAYYFSRNDDGVEIFCEYAEELVCFTIDTATGILCIDPNGNNPNIGPTNIQVCQYDGAWYEILSDDGQYQNVLVYTPSGLEKQGR